MSDTTTVSIQLLDRTYQLKCSLAQADTLKQAGAYLDTKMRNIQEQGGAIGNERITMMAAMDIAFELMQNRSEEKSFNQELYERVKSLNTRVTEIIDANDIDIPQRRVGEQQAFDL